MSEKEFFAEEAYRSKLAQELYQSDQSGKKELLNLAQKSREYWESMLYRILVRRQKKGLETEKAVALIDLLKEYQETNRAKGDKLIFIEESGQDVYNISHPMIINGITYIAGRVESRERWASSHVKFFSEKEGVWASNQEMPKFELEDPFWTKVGNELVFGGVRTWREGKDNKSNVRYQTILYRGKDIQSLKEFCQGPVGMKDIRLVELVDRSLAVFTRPRRSVAEKGKIGFLHLKSLDELTSKRLIAAKIIPNRFIPEEWGGVNQAIALDNNLIAIIGHISAQDNLGNKHYLAISFIFDRENFSASKQKIIASRLDFPTGEAKIPNPNLPNELSDVIFPGGVVKKSDGTYDLYCGLSDSEAGKINIKNPFKE